MSWIEPVSTVVTAASMAKEISDNSRQISSFVKRLIALIKDGKIMLPVFGAGGVGKSTIGRILGGENGLDLPAPYSQSWQVEVQKLQGDVPGTILVAPGQLAYTDRYWPDLINKANDGTAVGVINVVSYGYHSFMGISYKQHDSYKDGMSISEFMDSYLSDRRTIEIEMLNYLLARLAPANRKFFLISLISKQDLWWPERDKVHTHYTRGEYNEIIESFRGRIGVMNFHHEYVPTSLKIANLVTDNHEILASTSSGYDHQTHLRYYKSFFENLHSIATAHQQNK